MINQVYIKKEQLHGNVKQLIKCDVVKEVDGIMTVKPVGGRNTMEVPIKDVTPVGKVLGEQNNGSGIIQKQFPGTHTLYERYK
jgi:hypothetical protein